MPLVKEMSDLIGKDESLFQYVYENMNITLNQLIQKRKVIEDGGMKEVIILVIRGVANGFLALLKIQIRDHLRSRNITCLKVAKNCVLLYLVPCSVRTEVITWMILRLISTIIVISIFLEMM